MSRPAGSRIYVRHDGPGRLNYYQLSPDGYRLLAGPRTALPNRSFFREVSPALQRHTRHVADVHRPDQRPRPPAGPAGDRAARRKPAILSHYERSRQKPDYSFRLATRDGVLPIYDELDESTEPIASTQQRESLEAKIRFHEDYQNATGERYRVRMIFAKTAARMHAVSAAGATATRTRQRTHLLRRAAGDYLRHDSPLTGPLFLDHFNRLQSLIPPAAG